MKPTVLFRVMTLSMMHWMHLESIDRIFASKEVEEGFLTGPHECGRISRVSQFVQA
jgi:hypothetical protein